MIRIGQAVRWLRDRPRCLLEGFLAANLLCLAADVLLAHAANAFRHPVEWLPVWFSLAGGAAIAAPLLRGRAPTAPAPRRIGAAVGAGAIAVGAAGAFFHLESRFFRQWTMTSLVYAAPFAAPLAYVGLGCLLFVNRYAGGRGWGRGVVLCAAGGFGGNYLLALLDHERNGFWYWTEWIPVAAAALGLAALAWIAARRRAPDPAIVRLTTRMLVVQAGVGVLGAALHLEAILAGYGGLGVEALLRGAPPFAPLLFVDLAALAWIGLLAPPPPRVT